MLFQFLGENKIIRWIKTALYFPHFSTLRFFISLFTYAHVRFSPHSFIFTFFNSLDLLPFFSPSRFVRFHRLIFNIVFFFFSRFINFHLFMSLLGCAPFFLFSLISTWFVSFPAFTYTVGGIFCTPFYSPDVTPTRLNRLNPKLYTKTTTDGRGFCKRHVSLGRPSATREPPLLKTRANWAVTRVKRRTFPRLFFFISRADKIRNGISRGNLHVRTSGCDGKGRIRDVLFREARPRPRYNVL